MAYLDFITHNHQKTKRNYLARVNEAPKAEVANVASKFEKDYWDGDRKYGYGGYYYDGRWKAVAKKLIEHYKLKSNDKILDIGCGKGFLLYELSVLIPNLKVYGIDISKYAIQNAKEEVKDKLIVANATFLPFEDYEFDLVISLNTLHNLPCHKLEKALIEMQRVGKRNKYLVVESYRNENEKVNLLYWQLTCQSFLSPEEWQWWFDHCNYSGDHCFIYFE
jgi:ubiquinone/menaquinone biosynthesis C-methylase UbiE